MVDLTTTYLGLPLKNTLVASSSPLSHKVTSVQEMEDAGIAAVVMYSLFEEQIIRESLKLHEDLTRGINQFAEALTYIPEIGSYSIGPETYLEHLKKTQAGHKNPHHWQLEWSFYRWMD